MTARFRALDGWRGICAVLVALLHIEVFGTFYWQPLVRNAWMFVDFFFVLSGFVIAHAYGDQLGSPGQIRNFVIRRFGRLWPLHVTMIAAIMALEFVRLATQHKMALPGARPAFTGQNSIPALLSNLLLIQSFGLHSAVTWNAPAWSISTEFYTYLIFALIVFIAPSRPARLAAAAVLAVAGVTVLALFSRQGMTETVVWGEWRCLYGFFTGTLAYELWRRDVFPWLRGTLSEVATVTLVCVFLTVCMTHPRLCYAAPLVFGFTVLVFAREAGILSTLLTMRAPAALGRWSYSIYMVHTFVLGLLFSGMFGVDRVLHRTFLFHQAGIVTIEMGSGWADDLLIFGYLGVALATAAFTWRFVERPGQRFFNAIAGRRPAEVAVQTP